MRITDITCCNGMVWVTKINLWICDEQHKDSVSIMITNTRPTQRQVRKFKKDAKSFFRFGTRANQKMLRQAMGSI